MSGLTLLSTLAVVFLVSAYLRFRWTTLTLLVGVILLYYTFTGAGAGILLAWLLFLPVAFLLNHTPSRRQWLSAPVLRVFRKALPTMSATEREALEAGTVAWDGDLFTGQPDWNKLLAHPTPHLNRRERDFLDGPVEELCSMLDDWDITQHRRDLPPAAWEYLKTQGFFGMIIPQRYGGLEFSALAHSAVVMKISSRSISAAVTAMVPNSLGPAELLLNYGTEAQKDHYLPRLAKGIDIPCFALTSPDAGSDAASMTDTGVVCLGEFNGDKEVLGIRLNWEKRYITLGPVATLLGLAFKLYDPDHLLGERTDIGITLALIPTDTPGVTIGRRHDPLSMAFMNGPNSGKDVFIPMDWVIGGGERAGQGWRMLMECLAAGRSISLPALSTGAGKTMSRATGAYARIRQQFNTPVGSFEGVQEALARISGYTYQMEAARVFTANLVDHGEKPSVISAIVKYHLTERMRRVVNDAMDVQGGSGICLGPRNLLGRAYQALPISITVEGANILTRSMIIFGQGAIRAHPFVLEEMQAVADSDNTRALKRFDRALFGHIGFAISNAVRSLVLGITAARFSPAPGGGIAKRHFQHLTRLSAAFALCADFAMLTLGGSLKRRESLSARLGDLLSQLYLASCTLKHYYDQGQRTEDEALMDWACHDAEYQFQRSLDEFLSNFPLKPVAWLLRALVFPWGRPFNVPSDKLNHRVANIILTPGEARDRLTQGIHVPDDPAKALGRLEQTLQAVIAAADAEKKLRAVRKQAKRDGGLPVDIIDQALTEGIINEEEATSLRQAATLRRDAVMVDDFPADFAAEESSEWNKSAPTGKARQSM